jgi:hypothetical protein
MAVENFSFNYSDRTGDDTFQHLTAMLDFARAHNIEVILLMSPAHEWSIKSLEDQGRGTQVAKWRRRIIETVRANGIKWRAKPYPLWDFSARNSMTTEPVPTAENKKIQMKWWWDPSHYKTELGDVVLQKILGLPGSSKYPDFGRRLD